MMAGGHLDKGGLCRRRDALGFLHEATTEAALPSAGIDDQREHPGDMVAVLEARQEVDGDEADDLPVQVGDDHLRALGRETLEPLHDVAHPGRVSLVREQRCDALGIGDEFVKPTVLGDYEGMSDGDGVIFSNYRADRIRQIAAALVDPDFDGFPRDPVIRFAAALGMAEAALERAELRLRAVQR